MKRQDKYTKLSKDLATAYKKAVEAYQNSEDGGTCNFDAPSLLLPRWIEEKTKQAAKAAGLNCWKWELWGSKRFVFSLPVECGQGMRRTLIAEHMTRTLRGMGYDAMDYCQAD